MSQNIDKYYNKELDTKTVDELLEKYTNKKNDGIVIFDRKYSTHFSAYNFDKSDDVLLYSKVTKTGYLYNRQSFTTFIEINKLSQPLTRCFMDNLELFSGNDKKTFDNYIIELGQSIGKEINIDSNSVEYLNELSTAIEQKNKTFTTPDKRDKFYFELVVFIGELIKKRTNGEWKVNFNVDFSHSVYIESEKGKYDLWFYIKPLIEDTFFDLNVLLKIQLESPFKPQILSKPE